MALRELFPEIEPYNTGQLKVSDIHTLYFEEVGKPEGRPIVFLHGGPGGGISPQYRRFFDPNFYRVILFDQRGAGRSTPHAELRDNTTWHIVDDIERLRKHLNVSKWIVFGGSWGSTLALSYATSHPEPVIGLILRGIFLCRKKELLWFYQDGASRIFPDRWEEFLEPIPKSERGDLMRAYYKRLTSDDNEEMLRAAKAWSVWEGATSKLFPDPALIDIFADPARAAALARIECHYFVNNVFMDSDDQLLERAKKITHIPCRIVNGRYDVVCPVATAWELHKAWPGSELRIVPDAGHSQLETGTASELVSATEDFKKLYLTRDSDRGSRG